jgi:hypothetical protein
MKKKEKKEVKLTPELIEQTKIMYSIINPEIFKKFNIPNSNSK